MLGKHGEIKVQKKSDFILSIFAWSIFLIFWSTIFTFPQFYLFNPLDGTEGIRQATLIFSLIGWISMSSLTPAILLGFASGYRSFLKFLPISALIWPISLLVNHFNLYVSTGNAAIGYLTNYPIFFFTDLALPILLIIVWSQLRIAARRSE